MCTRVYLNCFVNKIMLEIYKCIIFLSSVVVIAGDVCYYNNGSHYGQIIMCPASCCGTGKNPCCIESYSRLPYVVGAIVSVALLLVCLIVCCVYRAHTTAYTKPLLLPQENQEQHLLELRQASKEYHIVVFSGKRNTKLELPPRYSDIYPQSELSTNTSADSASIRRNDSTRSSSLYGSLFRNSNMRNAFRRGQVKEPASFERNLSVKSTQKYIASDVKVSDDKPLTSDNTSNQTRRHSTTHANNHPDRSSLMSSIAASLPSLFKPTKM
ncbi:uncharacterized protein LOC127730786 [Mytilus californianus]|uniref:uncharacterized protein LOC127730786 n=1 Tax=Mytilus californianus TaxID=6549 RepID=UPI002247372A|nr:uncharacterized protein LOC127730786 [Mytilus californianus]